MILPFLRGILSFSKAPVTWMLVTLNVTVMLAVFGVNEMVQTRMENLLADDLFLKTNGQAFSQFIKANKSDYSVTLQALAEDALKGNANKTKMLGGFAIRDQNFMREASTLPFDGDPVARKFWLKQLEDLKKWQWAHPSYILGLSSEDMTLAKWISYQFIHSGLAHLTGNMIFLMVFGSALEPLIGGLALLLVYLASGMVAAGVFLVVSGFSTIPLVGASGAVSGVMALLCCMLGRRPVRYLYFLFIPKRGYAGYVYLPAWLTLFFWLLSDLAGYLGTPEEVGGIAHSAHLGGELAGLVAGAVIFLLRYYRKPDPSLAEEDLPQTAPVGTRMA